MNILVAGSTFPGSELDGSRPRFVYDLAESLAAHADMFALAPHHPGAARQERMGSVEVVRFRYWWPTGRQTLTPNIRQQIRRSILAKLQIPFFLLAQFLALRRMVRRHGIDVVNAHWLVPQGLTAALAKGRRRRFQLALHVHAGDVYLLNRLPMGSTIARFVVRRCDRIFADGSHVRDTLDALLGYESGAHLQPMGVHTTTMGTPVGGTSQKVESFPSGFILFVGRFVEKKGTAYLVRAIPRVLETHPEIGLVLVGSGPEEGTLRKEVERLGLEDQVRFIGHRPHEEIAGLLQHCRAAVVPSIIDRYGETEGMPTVVLEAMAAGAPVVGSDVDGIPDVIQHAENGWLCREKDPDDLAEKILLALASGPRSPVVEAAFRTGQAYDWSQVASDYIQVLGEAVSKRP